MMENINGSLGTIICINQQVKDGERRRKRFSLENRNKAVRIKEKLESKSSLKMFLPAVMQCCLYTVNNKFTLCEDTKACMKLRWMPEERSFEVLKC